MGNRNPHDSGPSWQSQTQVITQQNKPAQASEGDCLVIIYSKNQGSLGKRVVLDPGAGVLTIGRGSDNAMVLDSDSVSRRHARAELRDGNWWIVDNGSTNGTYVNDVAVSEHRMERSDHVKVGDTILKYLNGSDVEAMYHEEIYRLTIVDGLTQAHNKRYLFEQLEKEMSRSRRYGRPLSLLMFDLDHFKQVNDSYGHLAGDFVLRELSSLVRARIRRDEVLARYGGEEFAVLLPESDLPAAVQLANDVRELVAGHAFVFDGETIPVTVSIGAAQLSESSRTTEEFVEAADQRLLEAKRTGRNRVVA